MLIKILVAALLFGTMFFIKNKLKWVVALIITAYLVMLGAGVF